jgi:hypothetical protein
MSTEARAKPKASTTGRRAQGGFDRAGAALEPSRLAISLAHQQALQSGSELVRQQLGSTALADANRGEFAKAMAREMDLATIKPLGSQIAEQIAADRERRERLAELLSPCRGALEALRMQTSGLERIAEASFRRFAGWRSPVPPESPLWRSDWDSMPSPPSARSATPPPSRLSLISKFRSASLRIPPADAERPLPRKKPRSLPGQSAAQPNPGGPGPSRADRLA